MKSFKSFVAVLAATFITVSLTHCGKTNVDTIGTIPGLPSCGFGNYPVGQQCTPGFTFKDACYNYGGNVTTVNGTEVCRTIIQVSNGYFYGSAGFPVLNPSNPVGPYSVNTNFIVMPGDRLQISANGGWGQDGMWDLQCDETRVDGLRGNTVSYNEGMIEGLVGSDGAEVFPIGFSVNRNIKYRGYFRFGINTLLQNTDECSKIEINSILVIRCNDASGNTYTCS
ncbi:hypothetical protein K2X30_10560 [bacterium]|jgi:hypothetical protein|nr:hypothetical protein [bacterium]